MYVSAAANRLRSSQEKPSPGPAQLGDGVGEADGDGGVVGATELALADGVGDACAAEWPHPVQAAATVTSATGTASAISARRITQKGTVRRPVLAPRALVREDGRHERRAG
ncbi:hypothetical protein [Fodinicola feengrottensis]|uniref:hypothetical protein n=1 Tax=Fodinicola feengrottensis TaxID=435914 RepID=UPI0013D76F58|nr:hypothetical protein [Fodinicola feengrottensis]